MLKRRTFLTVASMTGLMPAAFAKNADTQWNKTVDVLVFGGGMAGLTAAISAKQNGAKNVLLLEKAAYLGGHSVMSGAGYYIGGTDKQKNAGLMILWKLTGKTLLTAGLLLIDSSSGIPPSPAPSMKTA